MAQDEPHGCTHKVDPGKECAICAARGRAMRIAKEPNPALSQERLAEQRDLAWTIERVILRRLRENKIDGYTKEMSEEIAGLAPSLGATANDRYRPPTPSSPETMKVAEDWYTYGFEAGINSERKSPARSPAR